MMWRGEALTQSVLSPAVLKLPFIHLSHGYFQFAAAGSYIPLYFSK